MENSPQYLFLASGVKDGEGFWIVGVKNCDENILDDKNLLECHRKELIGEESAKDILDAINLNLDNLITDLKNHSIPVDKPPIGVSFNIPLNVLEEIFDFWLDKYKNKEIWETCYGLLKIRKRVPLSNIIYNESIKGDSKKWALDIEELHSYRPNSIKINIKNEPMWR